MSWGSLLCQLQSSEDVMSVCCLWPRVHLKFLMQCRNEWAKKHHGRLLKAGMSWLERLFESCNGLCFWLILILLCLVTFHSATYYHFICSFLDFVTSVVNDYFWFISTKLITVDMSVFYLADFWICADGTWQSSLSVIILTPFALIVRVTCIL